MSAGFRMDDGVNNVTPAKIVIPVGTQPLDSLTDDQHEELLNYLVGRLKAGNTNRSTRLTRYARIDRMISTWQKLSSDDSKREQEEDNTGRNQAIPMNLPILSAHLEDTVAFFSEIFSSQSQDFYSVPAEAQSDAAKALAQKMNRDTKSRKYYKELMLGFRSLTKYNIGGYAVRWENGGGQGELAQPGNRIESLDMYNYLWDQTLGDVTKVSREAEWAARINTKNRMWLERRALKGELARVEKVFGTEKEQQESPGRNKTSKSAAFYRAPPSHVGLTIDGADARTSSKNGESTMDWDAYGIGLTSDTTQDIPGYEVIEMYCWLNPEQFGLDKVVRSADSGQETESPVGYSLWKFILVDSCQVCSAVPVAGVGGAEAEIPHYLGYMTVDDMKEAQRSVMELLRPFQRFASFLLNIYIAGARKNIWGMKGFDPTMFDMSKAEKGDVAGWIASKVPGRDVRTGMMTLDSNTGVDKSMEMMGNTMQLIQQLFPSQALPSQIAGIDRAIKNQVAAVMQGVQRRLHMVCKVVDSDIMSPMRSQCYRNLAQGDAEGLNGLDEEIVAKVLGSGLNQLNREAVASEIKEIIYAVLQNPQAASLVDLMKLMTYWSRMMDSPSDLGDFVKPQAPVAAIGPDGQPVAPGVMGASGLTGAPAAAVGAI